MGIHFPPSDFVDQQKTREEQRELNNWIAEWLSDLDISLNTLTPPEMRGKFKVVHNAELTPDLRLEVSDPKHGLFALAGRINYEQVGEGVSVTMTFPGHDLVIDLADDTVKSYPAVALLLRNTAPAFRQEKEVEGQRKTPLLSRKFDMEAATHNLLVKDLEALQARPVVQRPEPLDSFSPKELQEGKPTLKKGKVPSFIPAR